MKDIMEKINYKNKEYGLVFNLNVMEQIQDEYGSLDEWGKLTSGEKGEPNVKAVKFGFTAMLNEAIDMENEEKGTDLKPLTNNFVGRMLTEIGLAQMTEKLQNTVVESTKNEDEAKNV